MRCGAIESQAAAFVRSRIAKGTTVHADEASAWDHLHERFEVKRINHQEAYSLDGACTNQAEEYFSRLLAAPYRQLVRDSLSVYRNLFYRGNFNMPAAEITAGITSVRAAIDLAQAMIGKRDATIIAAKVAEMNGLLGEALSKFVEAQKMQLAQLDEIAALKAEIKKLRSTEAEKERYELKNVGRGISAYMLKPDVRGSESPHWLCPTCFENGKKSHLQFSTQMADGNLVYSCTGYPSVVTTNSEPEWL